MHSFPQPWGECARCGLDYRLNKLRKEWTGLRVCAECYDPRPPELKPPRYRPEGLVRRDAAPRTIPVFKEDLVEAIGSALLAEDGSSILLEDGSLILLEAADIPIDDIVSLMLLETGYALLLEDGTSRLLGEV